MPFYNSGKSSRVERFDRATPEQSEHWSRSTKTPAADPKGASAANPGADNLVDHEPVPLHEAAQRLEVSPEGLLTAFRAGDYRGFVDEGTLYIYVPEVETAHLETTQAAEVDDTASDAPATTDVPVTALEAQREQSIEIRRLLRANHDLQEEKDRLFRLLEREQVLRQGIQRTLDRAWTNLLPPSEEDASEKAPVQTIDRYGKDASGGTPTAVREDAPLDIGGFLGRHD